VNPASLEQVNYRRVFGFEFTKKVSGFPMLQGLPIYYSRFTRSARDVRGPTEELEVASKLLIKGTVFDGESSGAAPDSVIPFFVVAFFSRYLPSLSQARRATQVREFH
jgi:hypothetical protein